MKIFCSSPKNQYITYKKEINQAIKEVLSSGQYILGRQVTLFEKEFAKYIGTKYAVSVGSGTEALFLALKAYEIGKGDEVITVSHTAVATVAAIKWTGAEPVLIDIEPDYYTLNPQYLKKAISKRTKAIIPVHLYGQPANLSPILEIARQYGIRIIEDCCQAHGAIYKGKKVGLWGDIGCFSFYPTKNLGAIGDGGMIVTNNKEIAIKCRLLREYGWKEKYISYINGYNSRLDELQAAILRVKLKFLDEDNNKRVALATIYDNELEKTDLVLPDKRTETNSVHHLYVVRLKQRDNLKKFLERNDIYPLIHYPVPIHLQPTYKNRVKIIGSLKITEKISKEILSLPIYPELMLKEIKRITSVIKDFL